MRVVESATRARRGSRWIRSALVQAEHAAVRTKDSHLAAVYRRLVVRRGHKKAIMAVARRHLVDIYYMLKHRESYPEIGTDPRSEHAKQKLVERMQRRIEQLGYTVQLEAVTPSNSGGVGAGFSQ